MTAPQGFPLVAILPDLWTVYGPGGKPVSQHSTMALSILTAAAKAGASDWRGAGYRIEPPEHSPVVIAQAKAAIRKARESAALEAEHDMHVHCTHCQLWHHVDEDCPPPPRRVAGFDGSQEP